MAVSLGTLLLELKLDAGTVQRDLEQFERQAKQLSRSLDKAMKLVPEVDHRPLVELNKHLDKKQRHFREVNRYFASNQLKVKVDDSGLTAVEQRLGRITSKRIDVGISDSSGANRSAASDNQKLAEQIGQSVAKNMQPSIAGRIAGAVGRTANVGIQLAGGAIGNVAGGLTLGITQELTKNLGQGLSRSIERSLSSVIGSTGLAGEKLGDKLAESITNQIDKMLPKELQGIVSESIQGIIGQESIDIEGLFVRGQQRQRQQNRVRPAREQATFERREDLRTRQDASARLEENLLNVRQVQIIAERKQQRESELELQKADSLLNDLPTAEIDQELREITAQLASLANIEEQLVKEQEELLSAVKRASEQVKSSKERLERVRPSEMPEAYRNVIRQVVGRDVDESQVPRLMVADAELRQKGAAALYGAESNTIKISSELKNAIDEGSLNFEQMLELAEEVRHAYDFDFGSFRGVEARRRNEITTTPLQGTPEELRQIAPELALYAPEQRAFERNAKIAALRTAQQQQAQQQQQSAVNQFEGMVGFGGVPTQQVVQTKLAEIRQQIASLTKISDEMGNVLGQETAGALDKLWDKTAEINDEFEKLVARAAQIDGLSPEEINALQDSFVAQFERLNKIQLVFGAVKSDALKELRQAQTGSSLEQAENPPPDDNRQTVMSRAREAAFTAGQMVRGGVNIAQGAANNLSEFINSPTAQTFIKQTASAARAMGMVAGGAYKVAQGIEGIALDLIPMGRTLKTVGQQVVLPAATFGAVTHLLPGGQMMAEGMTHLAQGALSPVAQGVAGQLTGAAGNFIHSAVPGFLQGGLNSAATAAINTVAEAATQTLATIGTAVIGGKVMQNAVAKPLQIPLSLPASREPELALPSGDKPKALSTAAGAIVPAGSSGMAASSRPSNTEINRMAAKMTGEAVGNALRTVQDLVNSAKEVERKAQDSYKLLKQAIKAGDVQQVEYLSEAAKKAQAEVMQQMNDLLEFARDAGINQFGSDVLTRLGGIKGRISQNFNNANQQVVKFRNRQPQQQSDELESQRINVGAVLKSDATRSLIKDLMVNAAGYAASQMASQHGMVAGMGGDLMGALLARQTLNVGIAGKQSYDKLKEQEAFQAAKALEKFSMLLNEINQKLQSDSVQKTLGNELSGDLMGFAVGNLANIATGIPLSGAAAASAMVPRLQKLREAVGGNVPENAAPDELESARMLEFNRLNSSRNATPEQIEELKKLNALLNQAIKAADDFDVAFGKINRSSQKEFEQQAKLAEQAMEALAQGKPLPPDIIPPEPEKMLERLTKAAGLLGKAFLALTVISVIAPQLIEFARASLQAAMNFQAFSRGIEFVSRNSGEAQARIAAIAESADRLGVSLQGSRDAFLQLASATRGTSLEGASTDRLFNATQAAFAGMQLNPESQNRAIVALSQIAGKGVVSMEELRGQLSEAIPGAMNIAARAMGMTTSELNAFVASGQLASDVFLPKFAQQLQSDMAGPAAKAADSVQGSMNRMNNSILRIQETVGAGLLPIQKIGADAVTGALETIEMGLKALAMIIPGLAAMFGTKLILMLVKLIAPALSLANVMGLLGKGIAGIIPAIKAVLPLMGSFVAFAAKFAAFQLIAEIVIGAFSDMSRGIKEFADSSEQNLNRYLEKINELRNTRDIRPPTQQRPESFLGDRTFIGSIAEFFDPQYGRATLQNLEDDFARMIGQPTFSERQNTNMQQQFGRIDTNVQQTMNTATSVMNNELEKQITLERELVDLQTQRRGLLPGEVELRQQLTQRERELREQMEASGSIVAETRTQLEAQIKSLEEGITAARERGAQETDLRYMQARLKQLRDFQADFNKRGQQAIGVIQAMAVAFSQVAGQVKAAVQAIELMTSQGNTLISNAAAAGQITQGTADYTRRLVEQESLTRRIAANQEAIAQSRNLLESSEGARVLQVQGLSPDTSTDEIRTRAGLMEQGNDRSALEQYAEELDKLRGIEGETANLLSQLAAAREQAAQAIRDFGQQANDYFRGIARATEELRLTIRQNDLQAQINRQQARVIRAIGGFTDEFFGGVTSALEEFFTKLNEVVLNKQQQQLQELGLRTGFEDTLRQGRDLSRSAPGQFGVNIPGAEMGGGMMGAGAGRPVSGRTVRFQGIQVTAARDGSGEPGLDYVVSGGRRGAEFGSLTSGRVIEAISNRREEYHLERGDRRRSYGNRVIVRTVDQITGQFVDLLYAHLDQVAVQVGQEVGVGTVLGTQGRTGSTTAPHVSVDFFGKDSNRPTRASLNMRDRVARELQNGAPRLNSQIGRGAPQPQRTAGGMMGAGMGRQSAGARAGASTAGGYRLPGFLEPEFISRVQGMAQRLGTRPEYLLAVMGFETGGTFNPAEPNRAGSGARGLIQFMPSTARGLGTSTQALEGMSRMQQLGFVERYLSPYRGRMNSLEDTYMSVLYPAAIGRGPDHSLFRQGTTAYRQNQGLDANRDGRVTVGEATNKVRQYLPSNMPGGQSAPASMQAGQMQGGMNIPGISIQQMNAPGLSDIARGQGQATRNLGEQIQSQRSLMGSQNEVSLAEAQRAYEQFQQQLTDSGRRLEQTVRDSRRQAEDILAEALPDTAMNRFNRSLQEVGRQREDAIRGMNQSIESGQRSLQMLQRYRSQAQERVTELERAVKDNPELAPQLDNARRALELLDKQIGSTQENLNALQQSANQLPGAFDKRRQRIQDDFRREQEQISLESASRVFQSRQDLTQERIESFRIRGLDVMSRPMQRQMQIDQLEFDYSNQIRQIDEMVRLQQLNADAAAKVKANLEALNQVKLDNINTQFDVWKSEVLPGLQNSFQGLFAGIFRGTESLQDLLANFFGSLADQLAQLASQWLTNELFSGLLGFGGGGGAAGGLLGGGKSKFGSMGKFGGGGGFGGIVGGLLGGLLGFAEGGTVPAVDHTALMKGESPIAKALKREAAATGRSPVLAALSPGEVVLNIEQSRRYKELGLDRVLNFNRGGTVPGAPAPGSVAGMGKGDTYNIPITINDNGGNTGNSSDKKLDVDALRGVIQQEIIRQKNRPGGSLYGN